MLKIVIQSRETPMDEQEKRKSVIFPADLYQEIEDFRFDQRIKAEVEAIRVLVQMGLHYDKLRKHPAFAETEADIIDELNSTLAG